MSRESQPQSNTERLIRAGFKPLTVSTLESAAKKDPGLIDRAVEAGTKKLAQTSGNGVHGKSGQRIGLKGK